MRLTLPLLTCCLGVTGFAQVLSNGYTRFDLGISPGITAPVTGDFNGDGLTDLAVHYATEVLVYPGLGNIAFGPPVRTPLPEHEPRKYAHGAVAADFNVDGKLDLLAFGRVFLGSGDGHLQFLTNTKVQDRPQVFDINKDGVPDISGMTSPTSYGIVIGTPDGTFNTFYGDAWFEALPIRLGAVADLNADDRLDMLVDEGQGRAVAYLLNGDLQPLPPRSPFTRAGGSLNWSGWTFALTDVTGDKLPDLLTAGGYGALALFKGLGTGSFATLQTTAPVDAYFDGYLDFTVADLDNDGLPDIAATYNYDDRGYTAVTVNKGTGSGAFTFPIMLGELSVPYGVAPAITTVDWNGDGRLDLTTHDARTVLVFVKETMAVSSASGRENLTPGSLATLYRIGLTSETVAATSLARLPEALGGIQLWVDEPPASQPAELLYVSPTQINFRVPANSSSGLFSLTASTPRGNVYAGMMSVVNVSPALFPNAATLSLIPNSTAFLLTLYGTGLSGPAGNIRVAVNENPLKADFIGAVPEILGLDVVRIEIPRSNLSCLDTACTQVTANVAVVVGGLYSNFVTVSRQP